MPRYVTSNGFLTQHHHARMQTATTYAELVKVALDLADLLSRPVGIVCGPITSGGPDKIPENLERFSNTIFQLSSHGLPMFDQVPFENHLWRIRGEPTPENGYRLLNEFYRPLFESGRIHVAYFLSGWQGSVGATWERKLLKELGILILDIPGLA